MLADTLFQTVKCAAKPLSMLAALRHAIRLGDTHGWRTLAIMRASARQLCSRWGSM